MAAPPDRPTVKIGPVTPGGPMPGRVPAGLPLPNPAGVKPVKAAKRG